MKKKNGHNYKVIIIIFAIIIALFVSLVLIFYLKDKKQNSKPSDKIESDKKDLYSAYHISGNSLQEFDLYFLKLENESKNKVYSPLSIKYALSMLNEGANGETKKQISNIIGEYNAKKYPNNNNMSFANALFIKDSYQNSIKDEYKSTLFTKYNAEIFYDSFHTPNNLNAWISDKTFNLIPNMFMTAGEQVVVERGAHTADMKGPGGGGGESHSDFAVHRFRYCTVVFGRQNYANFTAYLNFRKKSCIFVLSKPLSAHGKRKASIRPGTGYRPSAVVSGLCLEDAGRGGGLCVVDGYLASAQCRRLADSQRPQLPQHQGEDPHRL